MHIESFLVGLVVGIFTGGFLSYKYAGVVITKTVAEYDRLKQAAENVRKAL
jgi:hypothetical protein